MNSTRLRVHEAFYGPAGAGAPDDLEIFVRNQEGLEAEVDPWVLLSRGRDLEAIEGDGIVSGQMTDELAQRAIWRQWLVCMDRPAPGAQAEAAE